MVIQIWTFAVMNRDPIWDNHNIVLGVYIQYVCLTPVHDILLMCKEHPSSELYAHNIFMVLITGLWHFNVWYVCCLMSDGCYQLMHVSIPFPPHDHHWYQSNFPSSIAPSGKMIPLVTYLKLLSIPAAYTTCSMPKIRDSGSKPDIFEVMTLNTQRGKRVKYVPVKEPLLIPYPSASPLKKWAWSPEVVENYGNDSPTDQLPKRSKTAGKVQINVNGCEILIR